MKNKIDQAPAALLRRQATAQPSESKLRREVEADLRHYLDLYDFAPVGYFILARDGEIRQANLSGARLLGLAQTRLAKQSLATFISAEFRDLFNTFRENVFTDRKEEECEVTLLNAEDVLVWARIMGNCSADGSECRVVMVDITGRKLAQEVTRNLSIHEELTGLYNRRYFEVEIARLERGRQFPVSIVMADVDDLKETNDRQGHAGGDAMLKRVARVLNAAFRAEDVIARIGGDEFGVLLPGTSAKAAQLALRRVRRVLQADNASQGGKPIGMSFGVSTAVEHASLTDVLTQADAGMYREKRGRDASIKS